MSECEEGSDECRAELQQVVPTPSCSLVPGSTHVFMPEVSFKDPDVRVQLQVLRNVISIPHLVHPKRLHVVPSDHYSEPFSTMMFFGELETSEISFPDFSMVIVLEG